MQRTELETLGIVVSSPDCSYQLIEMSGSVTEGVIQVI